MMEYERFALDICGLRMLWIFTEQKLARFFSQIMPQANPVSAYAEVTVCYKVTVHDYPCAAQTQDDGVAVSFRTKKAALFLYSDHAESYVDSIRVRESESLYYFLVHPLLVHVQALFHRLHLHGACICVENKGMVVLGPRNSGKTTLSMIALLEGHRLLTDDCIFVDRQLCAHSFPRPLHISPALGESLHIGDRIESCEPYMSDVIERNYRMEFYHPEQMLQTQSIDALLFPSIAPTQYCSVNILDDSEAKIMKLQESLSYFQEGMLSGEVLKIYDGLLGLPAYQIILGNDFFDNPRCIFERLNQLSCRALG
jgi:hypothetical protein